jgi:hypothetical protein
MGCASGREQQKIFDNSAFGYWLLAFGQKEQQPQLTFILRPSADWVWDWDWVWVALGWPLGHPSVDWRKSFVCNKS